MLENVSYQLELIRWLGTDLNFCVAAMLSVAFCKRLFKSRSLTRPPQQMYDLGKKKLLRKCENKQVPSMVVSLTVTGDRVFAGDQMESCHCFKYSRAENQLVEFADDQVKALTTTTLVLLACSSRRPSRAYHGVCYLLHMRRAAPCNGVAAGTEPTPKTIYSWFPLISACLARANMVILGVCDLPLPSLGAPLHDQDLPLGLR